MNLIESVYDIAEKFMNDAKFVEIDYSEISLVCNDMKLISPPEFPKENTDDIFKTCLLQLVGGAINYCYWYGKASIRPLDCCSTKMFDIVKHAFKRYNKTGGLYSFDRCLDDVIKYISLERFPLLEERINHLNELRLNGELFVETVCSQKKNLDEMLSVMLQIFPGYAADIFLKRAFLFFCQVNRIFGWFEDYMNIIPVPTDYQVPKMLEYYGIIKYKTELQALIDNEHPILKGSRMECELRSATMISCRQLVKESGWSTPQVDGYFWLRRKEVTTPFHLTITSDY